MIRKVINGNVFTTNLNDIAFAINTSGFNDDGFAGQVMAHTTAFANTGEQSLGTLISVSGGANKNFHGIVCHSLNPGGWDKAPQAITEALDKIDVPDDKEVAVVLMGTGMIGQMSGADGRANVKAIHASKKNCVVYSIDYAEEAILEVLGLQNFN